MLFLSEEKLLKARLLKNGEAIVCRRKEALCVYSPVARKSSHSIALAVKEEISAE